MQYLTQRVFLIAILISFSSCQDFDPTVCMQLPDGSKISSPFICNQFYVCEDGMLSEEGYCPQNMLFNPESKECDFAENVDCRGVPLPPEFETEVPATSSTTLKPETERPTEPPITALPTMCPPEDPEEPIFLPVENDCTSYIICFHGKDIKRSCSSGLYWNNESQTCDSSSVVNCKQIDKFGCPPLGIEFLPHPDSCKKFIYCRDGYSREQSCAFFRVFDNELKTCVFGNTC